MRDHARLSRVTGLESIAIGDVVEVLPLKQRAARRWSAQCEMAPPTWTCEIAFRRQPEIVADERISAWVVKIDHVHRDLVVSTSDFGFVPISDRMRIRYLKALDCVIAGLASDSDSTLVPEHLSEVKGMFTRCVKRDQPDWCAVYVALGRPDRATAERRSRMIGDAARALRSDSPNAVSLIAELRDPQLLKRLRSAAAAIGS